MLVGVIIVYFPLPANPGDNTLLGLDYFQIHLHRIRFAQESLFSPHPHFPGWYPRELLGTPFWSNIQSFPLLPTRLMLLGWDPLSIYTIAVILAAVLAAVFTFLFARRLGLGPPAAALAGWTFACSGFYASRVMAGHLPLLEAYPALPLLLWLVERYRDAANSQRQPRALLTIGLACGCISLAGHPQIPIYAMATAAAYALVRLPRWSGVRVVAAMAAGAGLAAIVLWPMWLLIGRSTRVLDLDPASNDIAFPYRRLIAFFLPWMQGWPGAVLRVPQMPVVFGDDVFFWETVCYVGWLPLVAVAYLLIRAVVHRRIPCRPWIFIAVISALGLLLAFPAARAPFAHLPGTFLRSPSRLLYLTTLGLALAAGAAAQVIICHSISRRQFWLLAPLALVIALHLFDLGAHDRHFIRMVGARLDPSESDLKMAQFVADGRVAIDSGLPTPLNREVDDVGYFDSIALARPYQVLLELGGQSPRLNTQYIDGSDLSFRGLAACGAKLMATSKQRPSAPAPPGAPIRVYPVANPAPRVAFYPLSSTLMLDDGQIHQKLRDPKFDLSRWLLLPMKAADNVPALTATPSAPAGISFQRDLPDEMSIQVKNQSWGFVRLLEANDVGWHATLDGSATQIVAANGAFMAIALPPGSHTVRLAFVTPGVAVGRILSALSLVVLLGVSFVRFSRPTENPPTDRG
jgi:hypothetical protein